MADADGVGMTDAELEQFIKLLRLWCETELDQFAHFIVPTRWGDVYADFGRNRPPGFPEDGYERLDWSGEAG
ncbi:hypothetical protein [Nocardia sp. NPDC052566]|uniref:hypothetical protein n=1 Tax=Nocardia sp. NPDC052566 TaxID=3364330 RepID=UPI0037C90303